MNPNTPHQARPIQSLHITPIRLCQSYTGPPESHAGPFSPLLNQTAAVFSLVSVWFVHLRRDIRESTAHMAQPTLTGVTTASTCFGQLLRL